MSVPRFRSNEGVPFSVPGAAPSAPVRCRRPLLIQPFARLPKAPHQCPLDCFQPQFALRGPGLDSDREPRILASFQAVFRLGDRPCDAGPERQVDDAHGDFQVLVAQIRGAGLLDRPAQLLQPEGRPDNLCLRCGMGGPRSCWQLMGGCWRRRFSWSDVHSTGLHRP